MKNVTTPVSTTESIDERKQLILDWFEQQSSWNRSSEELHERTMDTIRSSELPAFWLRPNHSEGYDTYRRSCSTSLWRRNLLGSTKDDLKEVKEELQNADMPNLPQDGSKGQWKSSMRNKIQAVEWLLYGNTEGVYGRRRGYPKNQYDVAVDPPTMYRRTDIVMCLAMSHDEKRFFVGPIVGFHKDDNDVIRANLAGRSEMVSLTNISPPQDELERIARVARGKPFYADEGDTSEDADFIVHPLLKNDYVMVDGDALSDRDAPVFGRIVDRTPVRGPRGDAPTYTVSTTIMDNPPTYENGRPKSYYGIKEYNLMPLVETERDPDLVLSDSADEPRYDW